MCIARVPPNPARVSLPAKRSAPMPPPAPVRAAHGVPPGATPCPDIATASRPGPAASLPRTPASASSAATLRIRPVASSTRASAASTPRTGAPVSGSKARRSGRSLLCFNAARRKARVSARLASSSPSRRKRSSTSALRCATRGRRSRPSTLRSVSASVTLCCTTSYPALSRRRSPSGTAAARRCFFRSSTARAASSCNRSFSTS